MVLRLDLTNATDRDFLEKRVGKDKIRELLSSREDQSILTNKILDQKMTSVDRVKTGDDKMIPKRSKYGNKKVPCKELGVTMDSIWEHDLYHMLAGLQKRGLISELKHQSHHNLVVNGKKICRLELDYEFIWMNKKIYADAKSEATSPNGFKMKVKLFTALFEEPVYLIERKKLGIYEDIAYGKKK